MAAERLSDYVAGEELHEALCAYHWPHFAARVLQTAHALGAFEVDALREHITRAGFGNPTLRWHEKGQGILTALG